LVCYKIEGIAVYGDEAGNAAVYLSDALERSLAGRGFTLARAYGVGLQQQ
jgi:hypothetical protein